MSHVSPLAFFLYLKMTIMRVSVESSQQNPGTKVGEKSSIFAAWNPEALASENLSFDDVVPPPEDQNAGRMADGVTVALTALSAMLLLLDYYMDGIGSYSVLLRECGRGSLVVWVAGEGVVAVLEPGLERRSDARDNRAPPAARARTVSPSRAGRGCSLSINCRIVCTARKTKNRLKNRQRESSLEILFSTDRASSRVYELPSHMQYHFPVFIFPRCGCLWTWSHSVTRLEHSGTISAHCNLQLPDLRDSPASALIQAV
ncbi:hypothetical protein AAY473_032774 [Plecturocebus cupreus]